MQYNAGRADLLLLDRASLVGCLFPDNLVGRRASLANKNIELSTSHRDGEYSRPTAIHRQLLDSATVRASSSKAHRSRRGVRGCLPATGIVKA